MDSVLGGGGGMMCHISGRGGGRGVCEKLTSFYLD
jgi:hypothetical protein